MMGMRHDSLCGCTKRVFTRRAAKSRQVSHSAIRRISVIILLVSHICLEPITNRRGKHNHRCDNG